ncbi:MAG: hypothetical protein K9G44_07030 [Melioribacteraceae bacterium]|nr:hypothetical protein [Melioribacteraceae bacterium]
MKKITIVILFLMVSVPIFPQSSRVFISPKADSLSKLLLQKPEDSLIQTELMHEYLAEAKPELALLEIMDLANSDKKSFSANVQKAEVLFWLERKRDAFKSFVEAYLLEPTTDKLKYLIILDYGLGNEKRSINNLRREYDKNREFAREIANLYQELFINNRLSIALDAQNLLKKFDRDVHDKYFPMPVINIIGSEDDLYTKSDNITLTMKVDHKVQLREISIDGKIIYTTEGKVLTNPTDAFNKTLSEDIPVKAGINSVNISAIDVYGYRTEKSIQVNGLNFSKTGVSNSSLVDSLNRNYLLLKSYFPVDSLVTEKDLSIKSIYLSGKNSKSDQELLELVYSLFTDDLSGKLSENNIQYLVNENASEKNMRLVFDKWLMDDITLRTKTFLYLDGDWEKLNNKYWLNLNDGKLNLEEYIIKYLQKSSGGLSILIDGMTSVDSSDLGSILEIVNGTQTPTSLIILNLKDNVESLISSFGIPGELPDSLGKYSLGLVELNETIPNSFAVYNSAKQIELLSNPAVIVQKKHFQELELLDTKLKSAGLSKSKREIVNIFCSDWRRYGEMMRFYEGVFTAEDLFIQAEEYLSRNSGGENEE